MTIRWKIVSNDNDTVVLRQETEEGFEEAELHRPSNVDVEAWLAMYVVGAEFGTNELHARTKFEHARRKDVGVLTASEQRAVSRWNRPDGPIKQVTDGMESLRVFLKNAEQCSMLEWARLLYIKHATRDGIGAEFAAISSSITLTNFIEKYEGIDDSPLDVVELERVEREGLDWKGNTK